MRSRWRLAGWGLLLVLLGLGLSRLRFDPEILNLLPTDQPTVQGLKLYQAHFANARELIITLRAPDGELAERLAGALAKRLRQETNLPVNVIDDPLTCVARGALKIIENLDTYKPVLLNTHHRRNR
jgi:predicted RND superfamily exporter protein